MSNKKQKFTDIMPEIAGVKQVHFYIRPEIVDLVVALVRTYLTKTAKATNKQTVYNDMKQHVDGPELIDLSIVRLSTTLVLLCQRLVGSKSKKTICAYLDCLICVAAFYSGTWGRELLHIVTEMVQMDLDGRPNPLLCQWRRSITRLSD